MMDPFASVVFTISIIGGCLAYPTGSHHESGNSFPIEGVPNLLAFGKSSYPAYNLIDLGSSSKGSAPPTFVEITKQIPTFVSQPYRVEVPVKVPVPVYIPRPYKVIDTKIVKVPEEFPIEVIRKVPFYVDVPKPYPVQQLYDQSKSAPIDIGSGFNHLIQGNQGGYGEHVQVQPDQSGEYQQQQESGFADLGGSQDKTEYAQDQTDQSVGYQQKEQETDWSSLGNVQVQTDQSGSLGLEGSQGGLEYAQGQTDQSVGSVQQVQGTEWSSLGNVQAQADQSGGYQQQQQQQESGSIGLEGSQGVLEYAHGQTDQSVGSPQREQGTEWSSLGNIQVQSDQSGGYQQESGWAGLGSSQGGIEIGVGQNDQSEEYQPENQAAEWSRLAGDRGVDINAQNQQGQSGWTPL